MRKQFLIKFASALLAGALLTGSLSAASTRRSFWKAKLF